MSDIKEKIELHGSLDYIIHCASITASKEFVDKPVDVIKTLVFGTIDTLELAKEKQVDGYIYLSSMDI